jgi:hypothetical protein
MLPSGLTAVLNPYTNSGVPKMGRDLCNWLKGPLLEMAVLCLTLAYPSITRRWGRSTRDLGNRNRPLRHRDDGLADPTPVIQSSFLDEALMHAQLSAMVTWRTPAILSISCTVNGHVGRPHVRT